MVTNSNIESSNSSRGIWLNLIYLVYIQVLYLYTSEGNELRGKKKLL